MRPTKKQFLAGFFIYEVIGCLYQAAQTIFRTRALPCARPLPSLTSFNSGPSPYAGPGVDRPSDGLCHLHLLRRLSFYGDIFSQIVSRCHKAELDPDFSVGFQFEALEAVILLDVAEDRLRFYRAIASVIQPSFTGKETFRFNSIGIRLMIHLDCPAF